MQSCCIFKRLGFSILLMSTLLVQIFVHVSYINWKSPTYIFSLFKYILLERAIIRNLIGGTTSQEGKLRLNHLSLVWCLFWWYLTHLGHESVKCLRIIMMESALKKTGQSKGKKFKNGLSFFTHDMHMCTHTLHVCIHGFCMHAWILDLRFDFVILVPTLTSITC